MGVAVDAPGVRHVVALGASAGGLDALERFFEALPPTQGTAYIVVQHLSPDHRTMMDELLARRTTMPVSVVAPDTVVEPDHVYVIAPGMMMTLVDGRLRLQPRPGTGLSLPIDGFFESMAKELGSRAIGVVLSGTGSDGTKGALALDAAEAWVLAQDPRSARFDGMPASVIAAGVVDRVLEPAGLAEAVAQLVQPGQGGRPRHREHGTTLLDPGADLQLAVQTISRLTRIDFQHYKPGTLLRRLERRLQPSDEQSLLRYCRRLEHDPGEVEALRGDLLIPVTAFFRDPEAFASLKDRVLRPLVQGRRGRMREPLRVWISATATGEEAYTVAMLLESVLEAEGVEAGYKVFATDVEPAFLARASAGRYPAQVLESIPPAMHRWLVHNGDSVQIDAALRHRIVFARHDLLVDPPFTHLDLVCCRNALIYLKQAAQERVLRRLEQALNVGGTLFLGSSETLLGTAGEYEVLDHRNRLFRLLRRPPPLPAQDILGHRQPADRRRREGGGGPAARLVDHAIEALLGLYTAAAIVITQERELVHVFGDARRFLRVPVGGATLDVLQMLDPALGPMLSTLVYAAVRDRTPQVSRPVRVPLDGGERALCLRVVPLKEDAGASFLLVVFEPQSESGAAGAVVADLTGQEQRHVLDLEGELAETRASLQSTIQDLGTANEELQATNEELMASNEELQGTNEELQSVNEELHTVNAELHNKVEALNSANADLEGLTRAGRVAMVFVDHELHVQRFTPEAVSLFRLRASDIGRRIDDLAHTLDYRGLIDDLQAAVQGREIPGREVAAEDGRTFLASILPYPQGGTGPRRVVATFVDISHVKNAQALQSVLDALPASVAVVDGRGRIERVNRAWREFAQANGAQSGVDIGDSYLAPCVSAAEADAAARACLAGLQDVLAGRQPSCALLYPCHGPDRPRWFLMHATPLPGAQGGMVVSHLEVSGWMVEDARGLDGRAFVEAG